MKFPIGKSLLVAGSFFMVAGRAGVVSAHTQGGSLSTGTNEAVDWYQVSCFDDGHGAPDHLLFQVKDSTANSAKVGVLVQKGTSCTTNACVMNSQDTTDTNTGYSPAEKVKQGAGTYNMYVHHTAAGTDSYSVSYHCETLSNAHTGTTITTKQSK